MTTTRNRHRVPTKAWKNWSGSARRVFNIVFEIMRDQEIFLHPKATPSRREHWKTTRWNAAWIAAEAVDAVGG